MSKSKLYVTTLSIGSVYILYRLGGTLLRRHFIAKLTALNEFSEIGIKSTRKSDKLRGNAVICGGSIAGLLVAKVCSDHFENVIIVESEEWVTTPEGYTGLPEGKLIPKRRSHVAQHDTTHVFQSLLVETLIKWFPGFREECEKLGGQIIHSRVTLYYSGLPFASPSYPKDKSIPINLRLSRYGLETLIRRLVINSCRNVRYLPGTALGLEKASGGNVVTGVRVRTSKGEEITLPSVLAIDCTGSSQAGFRWLKDLATAEGNEAAVHKLDDLRKSYNPKQGYRNCQFDVPAELVPRIMEAGFPFDWDSISGGFSNISDPKMDNRVFAMIRKDNNYFDIFLAGWGLTGEISSVEDIRSFFLSLNLYKPLPSWPLRVLDVLEENNVPLYVDSLRFGPAVYIQYHSYEYMPSNFIAIGDSIMKQNPIRGLGCSKACIEALSLNGLLNKCYPQKGAQVDQLPANFSKKFLKLQVSRTGSQWDMHKGQDYAWPSTVPSKGDDPKTFGRFGRALNRLILQLSLQDGDFAVTAGDVGSLLAPFTDLFAPRHLLKLLKVKLSGSSPLS